MSESQVPAARICQRRSEIQREVARTAGPSQVRWMHGKSIIKETLAFVSTFSSPLSLSNLTSFLSSLTCGRQCCGSASTDADPDADPDSTITLMWIRILFFIWWGSRCGSGSGSRSYSFQIKARTLEKVLKKAHVTYILACHLQIHADPDPAYTLMRIHIRIRILNFIWCRCGSGSGSGFLFDEDADPDADLGTKMMRIHNSGGW